MGRTINVDLRAETALKNLTIRQALVLRDLVSGAVEDLVLARLSALESDIRDLQAQNGELALANADLAHRMAEAGAALNAERAMKAHLEAEIDELGARLADGAAAVEEQSDLAGGLDEASSAAVADVLCVADADEASVAAETEDMAGDEFAGSDGTVPDPDPAEQQADARGEDTPAQESADGEMAHSQDCDPDDPVGSEGSDTGNDAEGDRRAGRRGLIEGALETRQALLTTARTENTSLSDASARLEHQLREAATELEAERQNRAALEETAALRKNLESAEELTIAA